MSKIPESIKIKALKALDQWANEFKIIGNNGDETPRFSQLIKQDGIFVLKSTQKKLWYELGLADYENKYLLYMDSSELWNEWKEIRTQFLLENHKTIHPY